MIIPIELFKNAYLCISDPNAEAFDRFVELYGLISGAARRAATVNQNRNLDFYRAATRLVSVPRKDGTKFIPKGSATCGNVIPTHDYDFFCSGGLSDVAKHIHQRLKHYWDAKGFSFPASNLISFIFENGSIDIHMGGMMKPLESLPEERERLMMILCNRDMSRFHPVVQAYLSLQGLTFIPNDVYKSRFIKRCYREIKENPTLFQILWLLNGSSHALPTFFLAVIVRISLTYGQNVVAELINRTRERHGDGAASKEFIPSKAREAIVFDAALQAAVALLVRTWGVWYKYRASANDAQAHYLRTGLFDPFIGEEGSYCKRFDEGMLNPFFERMRGVAKFGPYFEGVTTFEGLFEKMLTRCQLERFLKSRFDLPELLASVVGNLPQRSACPIVVDYAVVGMNTMTATVFAAALAYSGLPDIKSIRKMLAGDPKHRLQQIMHLPQLASVWRHANTSWGLPMDPAVLFSSEAVLMLSPMLDSSSSLKHWPTPEAIATLRQVFDYYWDYSWMFRYVEPIVPPGAAASSEYVPVVSPVAAGGDDRTRYFRLSYVPMDTYTARVHCSNLVGRFQGAAIAEIVYGKGWNSEREIWALCAQMRAWMDAAAADHKSVATTTAACSEAGEAEEEVKSP